MEEILNKSKVKNILVTGDFIVDRNLLPGQRRLAADNPDSGTRLIDAFGGSLLTYELLNSIIVDNKNPSVNCNFGLVKPQLKDFISEFPSRTAFSVWTKTKGDIGWKIDEIRGYGFSDSSEMDYSYKPVSPVDLPDWIIIDDGNLGFRNSEEAWPDFTGKKVILKCCYPFFEGKLFQLLTQKQKRPELLVIIVTLTNLRKSDVRISGDISWEQTALDIAAELKRNDKLRILLKADHLVVMTGASGALHFQNSEEIQKTEISLVFDPSNIEGEWEKSAPLLPGSGSCFLAAFSYSLANLFTDKANSNYLESSITTALVATRIFCRAGFAPESDKNFSNYKVTDAEKRIVKADERNFSMAYVPTPFQPGKNDRIFANNKKWSILRGNYLDDNAGDNVEDFTDLACELAVKGSEDNSVCSDYVIWQNSLIRSA